MRDFVHLHVHTQYSLLDGAAKIKDAIKLAKELGQKALAITDHGVMYGVVDFYKEAKKEGIKPIIGCEVYTAARTRFDKDYEFDSQSGHLILLAKNNKGYHNLIKIVSRSFEEGLYYKPRVDIDLLKEYSEGIIALSGCLAGDVQRRILANDYEGAKKKALEFNEIFKDGFYLELQNHFLEEDKRVIDALLQISKETNIPIVATNDAHYCKKEDAKMQNVLMCIQTGKTINEDNKMAFETDEFYIKSTDEMVSLFGEYEGAIENSVKIADSCNVEFDFKNFHLPEFKLPDGVDHFIYLKEKCYDGLKMRYPENYKDHIERLDYELSTIKQMGYVDYFLIVSDFINFAKTNDIPVGPGRGSAAGSIVSYCLKITEIDPIKYGLLFERFLNPERVSMPDIDIDFCYEKRQLVIDYVIEKYGKKNVAQIVTFGTMAAKAAIRDVGRVLGIAYAKVDSVAKMIPFALNMTLEKAIMINKELEDLINSDNEVYELIEMSKQIEGMPRHASTHAAGVIITKNEVSDYVPTLVNDNSTVAQFPMTTLEELGLLKMDFLGLRNLTIIRDTEKMVNEFDKSFKVSEIDFNDQNIYNMLSLGKTSGIFQLESSGIRQVLQNLKPKCIEDIIAVISLYRPGPMDSIPKYIENKNDPSKIKYKTKELEDILSVTYGCIVYQEQVMQIVRKLAGYSYGRADLVRRAMSKKKADVMKKEREIFINGLDDENSNIIVKGAIRNNINKKVANDIFDEMTDFAKYAFNKSHAACYAYVAYQTAFLKYYYPRQYMAAILTSVIDNTDKVVEYIEECEKMGIEISKPDINKSSMRFTVDDNKIQFGLVAIKNVGRKFIEEMVYERNLNGRFSSFEDFIKRMINKDLNKRAIESLIKAGAFDSFNLTRRSLIISCDKIIKNISQQRYQNVFGQTSLFGEKEEKSDIINVDEFDKTDLLKFEKEVTGIYISGHPLEKFKGMYENKNVVKIKDIAKINEDENIKILAIINSKSLKTTKNNQQMAFLNVEDTSASIEILVFPNSLLKYSSYFNVGEIVIISGKVSSGVDDNKKIILSDISPLKEFEYSNNKKLYLKISSKNSNDYNKVIDIIVKNPGNNNVVIYFEDTKKSMSTSSKGVNVTDEFLAKLSKILGKNNVIYK